MPKRVEATISHAGRTVTYRLAHRPRVTRRVHLELDDTGGLVVVAPRRMSRRAVRASLQQSAGRVLRFLDAAQAQRAALPDFRYLNGEKHLYLGAWRTLSIVVDHRSRQGVELAADRLVLCAPDEDPARVRELLRRWYRARAAVCFAERLAMVARRAPWTGGQAPPMRLRRMKRTWGNCSTSGVITLNPHLVKAPSVLIDYVIAHEICHLREHNHGPGFYALQAELCPGWREARARLRSQGALYLHE